MPSLKDLKNRISSVKSTRKITSAMKMVAAAKLRRAQDSAEAARPFAQKLGDAVRNLAQAAASSPSAPKLLTGVGKDQTHLLIVATAERGLCGGFNSAIVKQAREEIRRLLAARKTVKIITVGKKGREQLVRDYRALMVHHVDLAGVRKLGYGDALPIAADVLKRFAAGEFDVATLFYNKFVSVLSQVPTPMRLIPVAAAESAAPAATQYIYEPVEEEILAELLPKYVTTQIFGALLENAASEQGARMAAMDNATRNAGDMIKKLTLQYNRTRQAAITKELIEIISGAEAL